MLVNDFGSVNIDAELVVDIDSDVVSLANGCVCCSIRDDLVQAIHTTLDRPERPEYLLLEASGVAEPSGIATTFVDNGSLAERVRLDSITCVVDAEQVFAAPELMEVKIWQIAFADLLILNKVDLVTRRRIKDIRAWLDDRMHRYRLVEATRCEVPLEVLLGVGRFDPAFHSATETLRSQACADPSCSHDHHRHDLSQSFGTWSFESELPLSLEQLREAASRLPADIIERRVSCMRQRHPSGAPCCRLWANGWTSRFPPNGGSKHRERQIVAIGRHDVDPHVLQDAFERCQTAPLAGTSSG